MINLTLNSRPGTEHDRSYRRPRGQADKRAEASLEQARLDKVITSRDDLVVMPKRRPGRRQAGRAP